MNPEQTLAKLFKNNFPNKKDIATSKEDFIDKSILMITKEHSTRFNISITKGPSNIHEKLVRHGWQNRFIQKDRTQWRNSNAEYNYFKTSQEAQNLIDKTLGILFNPRRQRPKYKGNT